VRAIVSARPPWMSRPWRSRGLPVGRCQPHRSFPVGPVLIRPGMFQCIDVTTVQGD